MPWIKADGVAQSLAASPRELSGACWQASPALPRMRISGPADQYWSGPAGPKFALELGRLSPAAAVPTMKPTAHSASSITWLKGRTRSICDMAQEKKKLLRRTKDKARAASQKLGTADRLALRESGIGIDGSF
ncbi:hypothetical protein PGT21_028587 [Puccinia graminis f. sp. tritici]|uniref:Uncharacterized protein n=2 Tax=Puccinia graminis f. sp. tritici TaxID=56615 RepID=E3JSP1_PUCGT|nr:uncharacterized protein PGTG_01659 [Puccinia graminis f. sp. tritici CRL 75-36-700-3]EFP75066.2 hypothetical protein PGTG_01659 [Puccinia graminis f. sp. tritici CRL 75-36-700-3]KAA1117965.1 hypothetical protein PGT21_028587 [Puccinia graminis f. sp. tritici]